MVDWNTLFWGSPSGYAGAPSVAWQQRRALGERMGMPSPGTMAKGRAAERSVPMTDLSAIRQAMALQQAQRNQPMTMDPAGGAATGFGNPYGSPADRPPVGVPSPGTPLPPPRPPGLPGPQAPQAPQYGPTMDDFNKGKAQVYGPTMDDMPKTNPLVPKSQNSGQMYGPTMADMPNGGQPTYYTMDPGDGGILRTFLSKNGMPPEMSGYTVAGSQPVPADQGILAKILRGAF